MKYQKTSKPKELITFRLDADLIAHIKSMDNYNQEIEKLLITCLMDDDKLNTINER